MIVVIPLQDEFVIDLRLHIEVGSILFGIFVRAMTAAAFAAVTTTKVVAGREDHRRAFPVEIFSFDEQRRKALSCFGRAAGVRPNRPLCGGF